MPASRLPEHPDVPLGSGNVGVPEPDADVLQRGAVVMGGARPSSWQVVHAGLRGAAARRASSTCIHTLWSSMAAVSRSGILRGDLASAPCAIGTPRSSSRALEYALERAR